MSKLIIQPQTAEFVAKHPATGSTNFGTKKEPIYGKFTLAGMNSPQFYDAINTISKETDDDVEFGKRALAGCIMDWETSKFYNDDDGNPIEFSQKAAVELVLDKNNFWLASQLRMFVENTANFFS